jgi:4-amino-4-deoxy-L-arabinose transferase-like glycosyltransferase
MFQNSRVWVLIILVVMGAATLRLYQLDDRGIVNWDEAFYIDSAKMGRNLVLNLPFLFELYEQDRLTKSEIKGTVKGSMIGNPKPTYLAICTAFALGTGEVEDYTLFLLSALAGIAAVLMVFLYTSHLEKSWPAGVIAAVILSVSGMGIMYSRSAMAEAVPALLYLVACFVYLRARESGSSVAFGATGIILGFFFTSNYRWIFLVGLFVIFEVIELVRAGKGWKKQRKSLSYLLLGIVTIPLIFEASYWGVSLITPEVFPSYFQDLFGRYYSIFVEREDALSIFPHTMFVRSVLLTEGPMVLSLALLGVILSVVKYSPGRLLPCLTVLVPLCAFSLKTRGDRLVAISIIGPFLAILASIGLCWISDQIRKKRTRHLVQGLVVFVVLGFGLNSAVKILQIRSGYREAIEWVIERQGKTHFSTAAMISQFYTDGEALPIPSTERELERLFAGGYRYFLVDWRRDSSEFYSELGKRIVETSSPVAVFSNPISQFSPYVIDEFHYRHDDPAYIRRIMRDPNNSIIRIYDVGTYIQKLGAGQSVNSEQS